MSHHLIGSFEANPSFKVSRGFKPDLFAVRLQEIANEVLQHAWALTSPEDPEVPKYLKDLLQASEIIHRSCARITD
jgi:hypothetical protein